jgi:hypothetical protein
VNFSFIVIKLWINSSLILQTKFSYDHDDWWSRVIVSLFSLLCGYFSNVWIKSFGGIVAITSFMCLLMDLTPWSTCWHFSDYPFIYFCQFSFSSIINIFRNIIHSYAQEYNNAVVSDKFLKPFTIYVLLHSIQL